MTRSSRRPHFARPCACPFYYFTSRRARIPAAESNAALGPKRPERERLRGFCGGVGYVTRRIGVAGTLINSLIGAGSARGVLPLDALTSLRNVGAEQGYLYFAVFSVNSGNEREKGEHLTGCTTNQSGPPVLHGTSKENGALSQSRPFRLGEPADRADKTGYPTLSLGSNFLDQKDLGNQTGLHFHQIGYPPLQVAMLRDALESATRFPLPHKSQHSLIPADRLH